ncbi:MAG: CoA transferase [Burkholderiaceae bacterium]|nr:CoA transferase [Burkholderiaceae bacterium]
MLEKILNGYRVIDLTQNVAGPFCTQILGDLGAEIIKIERPGSGDDTRAWRPPEVGGESAVYLALNRNKKSVCIDLDAADGQAQLRKLVASADVFVHSLKPGSAEARGLGDDDLRMGNEGLIYCAISAFGEAGPLRSLPGYDPLMQAFTGIMSVTGNPGDDPVRVSVSLIDMGTGMWSALGILAAFLQRSRTGVGTRVSASLLETGLSWMSIFVATYLASGKVPEKTGSAMSGMVPYELFRSSDGYVFIAAANDRLFMKVCEALGCPELAHDARFLTNPLRVLNRQALHEELERRTLSRSTQENVQTLRRAGAPCSEMNDVAQAIEHEQVKAVGMLSDLPIPGAPRHQVMALPIAMNHRRSGKLNPPPALGAHTAEVLGSIGCTAQQLEDLRRQGVIA